MMFWRLLIIAVSAAPSINGEQHRRSEVVRNPETGGLENLLVELDPVLESGHCRLLLAALKETLVETNVAMFEMLDRKVFMEKVNIQVPDTWTNTDCGMELVDTHGPRKGDILVVGDAIGQHPWLHQYGGCGSKGEELRLPAAVLQAATMPVNSSNQAAAELGRSLADLLIRQRYGVFDQLAPSSAGGGGIEEGASRAAMFVTSRQATLCEGTTVRQVIARHPDFARGGSATIATGNWSNNLPLQITVTRQAAPRLVIVLENSVAMNQREEWDYVRAACKKFILHDLPPEAEVGLVLFNEEAHVAANVVRLGRRMAAAGPRNEVAFAVKSKHHLSPVRMTGGSSCVRCGVVKAIEALQVAGRSSGGGSSGRGGALIIISRGGGGGSAASNNGDEERELRRLSAKHGVQIFPITMGAGQPTVQPTAAEKVAGLERAAFYSNGESWLLEEGGSSYGEQSASLATYLGLVDALREIQARVLPKSAPHLVHEHSFEAHAEGEEEVEDSFILDTFAGCDTELAVYFAQVTESYIKSLVVRSRRGSSYSTISDTRASLHYVTMYGVPFDAAENLGMGWNYSLVRLPSPALQNTHSLQVTSASSCHPVSDLSRARLSLGLWTNNPSYEIEVAPDQPIILYAEVRLADGRPVANALVNAEIRGINRAGFPVPGLRLTLLDSGNGDPDLVRGDGVYSKYVSQPLEEGRYTIDLKVTSSEGSPAYVNNDGPTSALSYRDSSSGNGGLIRAEKLGSFNRILKGHSFRIVKSQRRQADSVPPARVLDLRVDVLTSSQQLEFSWTAPGDDYDEGRPTSYQLFYSPDPDLFHVGGEAMPADLVESFSAVKHAGGPESHRIFVKAFNQNLFYALVSVDDEGNVGGLSNIVKAYMPQPFVIGQTGQSVRHSGQLREGLFNPFEVINEPNKVVMYVVVGVVTVVIFTFLVVMLIMLLVRKARRRPIDDALGMGHEEELYTTKGSDLVRFGSVDLNLQGGGEAKLPKYIISSHHHHLHHIDPYGEYVGGGPPSPHHPPSSNFSSEDRLFPQQQQLQQHSSSSGGSSSSSGGSHHSMVTFIDPAGYHHNQQQQQQQVQDAAEASSRSGSPIYSRPLPRNQRAGLTSQAVEASQQQYQPSPGKSILKKPWSGGSSIPREEGDGEAAECGPAGDLLPLSSSSSYLETNLDTGDHQGGRGSGQPPPTLPKPLLCLDITHHPAPQLPHLRNLDVLPEQQLVDTYPQPLGLPQPPRPADRQVKATDSADRRIRNCTQV